MSGERLLCQATHTPKVEAFSIELHEGQFSKEDQKKTYFIRPYIAMEKLQCKLFWIVNILLLGKDVICLWGNLTALVIVQKLSGKLCLSDLI